MPYNRETTDKKLLQVWVNREVACQVDTAAAKRAAELGINPSSARALLIREAIRFYLDARTADANPA